MVLDFYQGSQIMGTTQSKQQLMRPLFVAKWSFGNFEAEYCRIILFILFYFLSTKKWLNI